MINLEPTLLIEALKIMLLGMGGIFLVISIIYLASVVLLKIFPESK